MPTSDVALAIVKFLREQGKPVSAEELSRHLSAFHPREIREAVWQLTAASEAEMTWDWKLQPAPSNERVSPEAVPA